MVNIKEVAEDWRVFVIFSPKTEICQTEKLLGKVQILFFDSASDEISSVNSFDFKWKQNHHHVNFPLYFETNAILNSLGKNPA